MNSETSSAVKVDHSKGIVIIDSSFSCDEIVKALKAHDFDVVVTDANDPEDAMAKDIQLSYAYEDRIASGRLDLLHGDKFMPAAPTYGPPKVGKRGKPKRW